MIPNFINNYLHYCFLIIGILWIPGVLLLWNKYAKDKRKALMNFLNGKEYIMLENLKYIPKEGRKTDFIICDLIFYKDQIFMLDTLTYFWGKLKIRSQITHFYPNLIDPNISRFAFVSLEIVKVVPGGKHFFVLFKSPHIIFKDSINQFQFILKEEDIPIIHKIFENNNWAEQL